MGIPDPGRLSLGEWGAICDGWKKAHGKREAEAPSDDEFLQAVMQSAGAAG